MADHSRTSSCPQCKVALNAFDIRGYDYWVCGKCSGHAVLDKTSSVLLGDQYGFKLVQAAQAASKPSKFRCPFCKKPMLSFAASVKGKKLELDRCSECSVIWLKKGERELF